MRNPGGHRPLFGVRSTAMPRHSFKILLLAAALGFDALLRVNPFEMGSHIDVLQAMSAWNVERMLARLFPF
jgi:hypothetical protein